MSNLNGRWEVVAFRRDGEMVNPEGEAYLEIEGDRLSGTMGVNRVMGPIGENGLNGPLASTMMAGPQHLMDQEYQLNKLLDDSDRIVVGKDGMSWLREGLTMVEFKRSGTEAGVPAS